MADEIQVIQNIKVTNGGFRYPDSDTRRRSYTQTNVGGGGPGTIDATNDVEIGVWDGATFHKFAELKAAADGDGMEIILPCFDAAVSYRVRGLVGTAEVLVIAFEE